MKKRAFVTIFLGTQLAIAFTYISLRTCIISQSFAQQRNEKNMHELSQKKEFLSRQLIIAQNSQAIKEYAVNELGMQPIAIDQIKMVDLYEL